MLNATMEPDKQGRAGSKQQKAMPDVAQKLKAAEQELDDLYIEFLAAQQVAKDFMGNPTSDPHKVFDKQDQR